MTSTRRTYVLDTSVLLSEPQALRRFEEHAVVLPLVVLTELEAKRNHRNSGGPRARHSEVLRNSGSGTVRCSKNSRSTSMVARSGSS